MGEGGGNVADAAELWACRARAPVWLWWAAGAAAKSNFGKGFKGLTMADSFKDREKGAEAKYAHDEETRFKIEARRNKLLGLWAAGEMGMTDAASDAYAKEVIAADFEEAGDDDVLRKVARDFAAKGVNHDKSAIRQKMDALLAIAGDQIVAEKK
jgi:hypothetical protein